MNKNILSLTRFAAAIIVILFHQRVNFDYLNRLPDILIAGPQMCTFFFVLSGFVLSLAYSDKKDINTTRFIQKRLKKIYPIYFISLVLTLPILFAKGNFDIQYFSLNLLLLQSWFPTYTSFINTPAWFLSDLLFFYVTFPFLTKKLHSPKSNNEYLWYSLMIWATTQALLTLLLNSSFYKEYPSVSHDLIYYFPLSHYCSFLLGVFGGSTFKKLNREGLSCHQANFLVFTVLGIIILGIHNQESITESLHLQLPFNSSLYAPLFLLFIIALFLHKDLKLNDTTSKFVTYLGALSFPIYILQSPVASYVFFLSKKLGTTSSLLLPLYFICLLTAGIISMKTADYIFTLSSRSSTNLWKMKQ